MLEILYDFGILMTLALPSVTHPTSSPKLDKELGISLVVPVFNQERKVSYSLKKIKQAVESAFTSYELIVVNDGSIDNTLNILRDIEAANEHMHTISYTPNSFLYLGYKI